MDNAQQIYQTLTDHGISFERFEHPAVFTCNDVEKLTEPIPGVGTKNLFLRDDKGARHFLVSVRHECTVDLKALGTTLGVKKISFASSERMMQYLGVEPGAVTLLGIVNDGQKKVEVIIEAELWKAARLQCHPLVNTATVVLAREDIERLCKLTGHTLRILEIPQRLNVT